MSVSRDTIIEVYEPKLYFELNPYRIKDLEKEKNQPVIMEEAIHLINSYIEDPFPNKSNKELIEILIAEGKLFKKGQRYFRDEEFKHQTILTSRNFTWHRDYLISIITSCLGISKDMIKGTKTYQIMMSVYENSLFAKIDGRFNQLFDGNYKKQIPVSFYEHPEMTRDELVTFFSSHGTIFNEPSGTRWDYVVKELPRFFKSDNPAVVNLIEEALIQNGTFAYIIVNKDNSETIYLAD